MAQTIIVRKRYGDEWLDARQFIRPSDWMMGRVMDALQRQGKATIRGCWQWVVDNITYPPGPAWTEDAHTEIRYHSLWPLPRFVNSSSDFWNYPSETLRDRMEDCDGRAILLCSMLRSIGAPAWFTVGMFRGPRATFGHCWVTVQRDGKQALLETTLRRLPPPNVRLLEGGPYDPWWRCNESTVSVIRTPAVPRRMGQDRDAVAAVYRIVPTG